MTTLVTMTHSTLPGETKTASIGAYRGVWYGNGWRSADDPDFTGDTDTPQPPSTAVHASSLLDDGLHGIVERDWVQDGTTDLTRTVMSQHLTNGFTAAVVNGFLVFSSVSASGDSQRECWRIGDTAWADSEMTSLIGRPDSLGGSPNAAQWGHMHRVWFDTGANLWKAFTVWTDILFALPPLFNAGVVSWAPDGTGLALNSVNLGDYQSMWRNMPIYRAQRTSNVATHWTSAPWLDALAVGDLIESITGMADTSFNATNVTLTAIDRVARTFSFAQTASNATDASAGGLATPPQPHRTLPMMLSTRLIGNTVYAKQWRPEEPEPDWTNPYRVFSTTPGAGPPAPYSGTGDCALWVAHLQNPNKSRYGGVRCRHLH